MNDKSLLDEIQEEQLADADAEVKFAARLATVSDQEFNQIKRYLCNLGDRAKREAKPTQREMSDQEQLLNKMDSAEYVGFLKSIGINSKLDVTLTDAMKRERKRRADGGQF